eukprot:SAG31_NODE_352_length_17229_cov_9.658669_6_plen_111_part_00
MLLCCNGADGFVINLGKLMARWTNDMWQATVHRVVNPPISSKESIRDNDYDANGKAQRCTRRQSLIFFLNPNYDAIVECIPSCKSPTKPPRYPPISSGDLLRDLLETTMP